ncbi:MAG TPA: NAD(P)/FAD-dependent oxidoreductase [Bacillota bacterium]
MGHSPSTPSPIYDVAIIGAGIVGAMTARALAGLNRRVIILERGVDPSGATKANSGIVHPGYDPEPGTAKAKLGLAGARRFASLASDLGFPFNRCGSLMLAFDRAQLRALEMYLERGRGLGLSGLAIWGREEVLAREPAVSPEVVAALHSPDTAVTSPFEAAVAAIGAALAGGAVAWREAEVTAVSRRSDGGFELTTARGTVLARRVVNAAGLDAGRVAALAGQPGLTVTGRVGEYLLLDRDICGMVRRVLYPVPTATSKGILVVPTVHGNLLLGPNAADLTRPDEANPVTAAGLDEVVRGAVCLVPSLPLDRVITTFAGTRAVAHGGDFAIAPAPEVPGLVNAAGVASPGLSASPAIADEIARLVTGLDPAAGRGEGRAPGARASLGGGARIVCRCEGVTEADVVAAIHAPFGACTLDGVKQRTRAGMGRCQGAFCGPRVVEILARELGVEPIEVHKNGPGGYLFAGRTKEVTR